METLRTSYDLDGIFLELLFDPDKRRYLVATRYQILAKFHLDFDTPKWRRIVLSRASAVFEICCMFGAEKRVASLAKAASILLDQTSCVSAAGYEKEVIRRTANKLEIS